MKKQQKKKSLKSRLFSRKGVVVMATVLVVGAAGFFGWRTYSSKNLEAKAYSWTTVYGSSSNAYLKACKTLIKNKYGGSYRVSLYAKRSYSDSSTGTPTYYFYIHKSGGQSTTTLGPLKKGAAVSKTTYASVLLGDTYSVSVSSGQTGASSGRKNFSTISNC